MNNNGNANNNTPSNTWNGVSPNLILSGNTLCHFPPRAIEWRNNPSLTGILECGCLNLRKQTVNHANVEMMNIEEVTTDPYNLFEASNKVRKSSPNKYLTQQFMNQRLINIKRAQEELHQRCWKITDMLPFIISERGHLRQIKGNIPYDRTIMHSYVDNCLQPYLSKYLIYDNYASQPQKGTSVARDRFKKFLGEAYRYYGTNKFYVLLTDFRKFYDNVQHEILFNEIMRKIPYDEFHEYMIWTILDSFKVDVSWMTDEEYTNCMNDVYIALDHIHEKPLGQKYMSKSLNIGNLASQLFSVYFPTRIDTYCKIVKQIRWYGRYMDDISIIHNNKDFLWKTLDELQPICDELGLYINHRKTQLFRVDTEFKYLNRIYSITNTGHIKERIAPNTLYREQRMLKKLKNVNKPIDLREEQFRSWIGSFKHSMSYWEIERIYKIKQMCYNN